MIPYHGLPLWPQEAMTKSFTGRHAMVSFERPDQIEEAAEICRSVVLDNGAFSAWANQRPYDFDGYHEWCRLWLKHPAVEWCLIPDVIDGDEGDNDELLLQWDLPRAQSVPVFHLHEDVRRLKVLTERYTRVALGSSGVYANPGDARWWGRMSELLDAICDPEGRPPCKLHGLRMLDTTIFAHVPFASADSCNVARNVGLDVRWNGPYVPRSPWIRALVIMDRIESHAAAVTWCRKSSGVQQNFTLLG